MKILSKKDETSSSVSLKEEIQEIKPVMLEDSVKEDTNFSLDALLQGQIPERDLSQNFGSKLHKDSEGILSHHGTGETDDHLLGKRSDEDPSLRDLLDQVKHLNAELVAKDLVCQGFQRRFDDTPTDLEYLRAFPEFYSETVQTKYLQLKSKLQNFKPYLPIENPDNPKEGPFFYADESSVYQGQYLKHKRHGLGKIIYKNGSYYEGTFRNDKFDGYGVFIKSNGDYVLGEFENGAIFGAAEYTSPARTTFVGNWRNNKKNGFGKESINGGPRYEGDFIDNK